MSPAWSLYDILVVKGVCAFIKKVLLLIAVFCFFLLTGCETEEERLQRNITESEQRYREAVDRYNDLQRDIDEYEYYRGRLSD